ncbi:MAG: DUF4065 domain-containing protein [Schwartzia sp.]|nr:DUF4065 domain-containing protein [Schwartzia sp. (in: firmicutes)]
MADARAVARLFIELANDQADAGQGDMMTNLRLQKLLYFAQGWMLAQYGKPLFPDRIEAWKFGPVVPSVYRAYKPFGNNPLSDTPSRKSDFSPEEYLLLFDVYSACESLSTAKLVSLTHEAGTPWSHTYNESRDSVIPESRIRDYFREAFAELQLRSSLAKLNQNPIIPARGADRIPVLPKEFDYAREN